MDIIIACSNVVKPFTLSVVGMKRCCSFEMKVNSHLRPHVLCLASQSVENVEIKAKYDESQSKVQTLQNQVISLQVWHVFGGCVLVVDNNTA